MTTEDIKHDLHAPAWPLAELNVSGLFGTRGLSIGFERDATIFTGENGSGKSTLLKAIDLLAAGDWRTLLELPLRSVSLSFSGGERFDAQISNEEIAVSDETGRTWVLEWEQLAPPARHHRDLELLRRRIESATGIERQRYLSRYTALRRHFQAEEAEHWRYPTGCPKGHRASTRSLCQHDAWSIAYDPMTLGTAKIVLCR